MSNQPRQESREDRRRPCCVSIMMTMMMVMMMAIVMLVCGPKSVTAQMCFHDFPVFATEVVESSVASILAGNNLEVLP